MRLCIDIGNTFEKIAVFDCRFQRYFHRTEFIVEELLANIASQYKIDCAILCSTKLLRADLLASLEKICPLTILETNTPLPIKNLYETPDTLGKDRIAAVTAAHHLFPLENNMVISAGTCITVDVIDKDGNYQGGNIHPGIAMRLRAMHEFTQKLPLVEAVYKEGYIGKNTSHALQNGAVRGAIWEISSFIARVQQDYEHPNLILTGGDSKFFEDHTNFKIFALPNLVLVGLNEILQYNS